MLTDLFEIQAHLHDSDILVKLHVQHTLGHSTGGFRLIPDAWETLAGASLVDFDDEKLVSTKLVSKKFVPTTKNVQIRLKRGSTKIHNGTINT